MLVHHNAAFLCKGFLASLLGWFISLSFVKKVKLNSDSHQFHLYQQNEQSPLTSRSENTTKDQENKVGNPKRLFLCNSLDVIQQSIYQLLS
jgi:hypothetical protein